MLGVTSFVGQRLVVAQRVSARAQRVSVVTVEAKLKPTKASEFRGLSYEEIDAEVAKAKRVLLDLRIKQRTRQVGKSVVCCSSSNG